MEEIKTKDIALEEWLDRQEGRYKQKCEYSFAKFIAFIKEKYGWDMNGDSILAKHKANRKSDDNKMKYFFDDIIPSFIMWIEHSGNSHNSAFVQAATVKGFFKFHREPLQVQDKGFKNFREVVKRYHAYTKDELVKMVQVGDVETKAVIELGVQLGIRVGDFVSMKRNSIIEAYQNSNGEFPLEFQLETAKEHVISVCHISKSVYETLLLHWNAKPQSQYVFAATNGDHINEQRSNDILKDCWLKAFPERANIVNTIRFHELRSYKISTLVNLGTNDSAIKKMTGKKVEASMNVYMTGINLKEIFVKAEQALTLTQTTNNNHGAIEELKNESLKLKAQLNAVTERLAGFEADIEELKYLKSEVKFFKEGNWEIAYSGPELKEQMIEEIRERERLRKEKAQQKESPNT